MRNSQINILTKLVFLLGLLLVILPLFLVINKIIGINTGKILYLLGVVSSLYSSPIWLSKKEEILISFI